MTGYLYSVSVQMRYAEGMYKAGVQRAVYREGYKWGVQRGYIKRVHRMGYKIKETDREGCLKDGGIQRGCIQVCVAWDVCRRYERRRSKTILPHSLFAFTFTTVYGVTK